MAADALIACITRNLSNHNNDYAKLEQLECLPTENNTTPLPHPPMITQITHTIDFDSYQIPCHNKTKSNLQIKKICQKFTFWNFAI